MAWCADWEARFDLLVDVGFPALLRLELSAGAPGLWVLSVQPLAPPALWAPRDFEWGYHVSIAEEGVPTAEELRRIRADFDGRVLTLQFWHRQNSTLLVAGVLWCHEAVSAAPARGWYRDRPLHLSL
jgi:hypothetical protein